MATECRSCGGRAELVVCWKCAKRLRRLLVGQDDEPGLDWFAQRLAEQAYGQAKMGRPGRSASGGPAPLPLNQRAAELLAEVTRATASWAGEVFGVDGRAPFSPAAYCHAIARDVAGLMAVDGAARMIADADRFNRQASRVINRPPDLYCGPCPNELDDGERCGMDLRAEADERMVQCRRCRAVFDVELLRERLLQHVDDEPKSAADLLRLFRWLGVNVPRSTFYYRVNRVPPRMFLHKDGTRNLRRQEGSTPLYAYSDVRAAIACDDDEDQADADRPRKRRRARRQHQEVAG
ncbi:hypothetical protein PBI_CHEETOBRO_78 [Mycobacterium phage Cheetobro]|uniref:hypothetical protein n=1 Tax=Mycobacterium phage Cheetobro TaxID=1506716 RepID=UPI0004E5CB45|nr:hypothetical protein PBI_CHEETOBRO_78 [Mycobacterium phage Cheetobro]AII27248.1 hypothetical protein PBI_CHEETOBRO_78 [Mycobacterium phage Cheetobro]